MIKEYVEYLKDNPKGYWFKAKLYGWGWTPVTWQGWLIILIYILTVIDFALTANDSAVFSTFILPVVILTTALIITCYKKGEKPRWQWGLPKKDK
jgi:hypothetical protein